MSNHSEDKVILITGATSGIGKATALHFAGLGARVIAAARSDTDIATELMNAGAKSADFISVDVTDSRSVQTMIEQIIADQGRLDFAFNNAGIFRHEDNLADHEEDTWQEIIAANLSGVYHCMKAEVNAMLAMRNPGVIVNNASIVSHRGSASSGVAYTAAKHGVLGLTRQAAIEYAATGIRVNAVSPGPTLTPATSGGLASAGASEKISTLNPTGELVPINSIAETVAFLCSPAAAMINGQDIPLDGGQLAKL